MLLLHRFDVAYLFNGLLDGHVQVVEVDGLRGKVEGTVVHRLADITHVAVGRHHDALHGRILHLVDLREQRQTVHLGHIDVAQDDVKVFFLEQHRECFQAVVGKLKLILSFSDLSSKVLCQQQFEIHLIVDT